MAEAGHAALVVETELIKVYIEDAAIVVIDKGAEDEAVGSNVAIDAIVSEAAGAIAVFETPASSRNLFKKEVMEDISMSGGYICSHL